MSMILIAIGLLLNLIGFSFFNLRDYHTLEYKEKNDYYIKNNFRAGFKFNLIGFLL